MDKNEKKILIFTCAAHYLTHFFILIFPVLIMPLSREFLLKPSEVIPIGFPMYLCYGILAIPWGYSSDRIGPRWILGAGVLLSGIGFIAASFTESVADLTICLAITGIGCSAYHPSGMALISKGIKVRGRALGINGMWGNLGIASAPLLAGVMSYWTGWKTALLVFGLTGVFLGIICFLIPFSIGREDLQKSTAVEKREAVTLFIILCIAMLFSGLMYRGYTIILPTFFENRLADLTVFLSGIINNIELTPDADTLIATLITSGVYLIGMIGQYCGGRIADRFDLRWSYFMFFLFALPFLILIRYLDGPLLIAAAGFFILFSLGMQPIENSLVAIVTPPQWRSVSYGIKFTIVFGAGSLAVPLVSIVEGSYGLNSVIFLLVLLLSTMLCVLGFLLVFTRGTTIRHET